MPPHDLVGTRVRVNLALEVHVVALLDVVRIHVRSELQVQDRDDCNRGSIFGILFRPL